MITPAKMIEIKRVMPRVERAVRFAERQIMAKRWPGVPSLPEAASFFTEGPRSPVYESTEWTTLLAHHEKLALPEELHYASFGAGLGVDSFLAGRLFQRVAGFEIDPLVADWAERIRVGFEFENVSFQTRDYVDLTRRELAEFDVIYLYMPFGERFAELTGRLLLKTKRDTLVISHKFYDGKLFPEYSFRAVFPSGLRVDGPRISAPFYAFKRT